jgi:sugar (pentulose or hexulose) kinase
MSARPSGFAALGAMAHARSQQGAPSGGSPPVSLGALSMARGGQTFAKQGQVQMGTGTSGTADKVPAMLSEDEYVLPADVTSHLGNGSSNAGGKVLDKFVQNVRAQRGVKSKGLPPSAKSPEQYIGK